MVSNDVAAAALQAVLAKHMTEATDFIYAEKAEGLNQKLMTDLDDLLVDLKKLDPEMSWPMVVRRKAFLPIAQGFDLKDKVLQKYVTVHDQRLYNLCRHYKQAIGKREKAPLWVLQLKVSQGSGIVPQVQKAGAAAAEEVVAPTDWLTGYDFFKEKAWRVSAAKKKGKKDYTDVVEPPKDAKNEDLMVAKWPDKFECKFTELDFETFSNRKTSELSSRRYRKPCLWEGVCFPPDMDFP